MRKPTFSPSVALLRQALLLLLPGLLLVSCQQAPSGGAAQTGVESAGGAAPREMTAAEAEGQNLYRTHCASCHSVHDHLSGPALAGVSKRWLGYENDLVEFVQDSQRYIKAGKAKSAYAEDIYQASDKMVMPPVRLSPEEIRKVLTYVQYAE